MQTNTRPIDADFGLETAARHATVRVPIVSPEMTAAEAIRTVLGGVFDTASLVVVQRQGKLLGIVRIEPLLAAPGDSPVSELMDSDPPVVAPGVDQEVAAWKAVRHGEAAIAVVTADGDFVGVIPPHRLLEILLTEHDEDLTRLGGFLRGASEARTTSLEPVPRRFKHRLPWLLVGLAGALLAAGFVGRFERQLQETVMLAFFMPAIIYLADAVGTQTETVVVRGLSVGVGIRSMVRRELIAGLAIGTALAALAGPVILWWWRDARVALIVGLSLFAACSTATLVAMLLPWLLSRSGRDPAFGSGPVATVIQDLLSILIYLGIASAVI